MRTLPFIATVLALWAMFDLTLYLAFGLTFPTLLLATLSFCGIAVSMFTYRYYGWPFADRDKFNDIRPADLYSMMEKGERLDIIDVRRPAEFARGHLPSSRNVPFYRVDRRMVMNSQTVFVSNTGRRSRVILRIVKGKQLFNLREGFEEWTSEHLPVEK